jgi:hypothetical protein
MELSVSEISGHIVAISMDLAPVALPPLVALTVLQAKLRVRAIYKS